MKRIFRLIATHVLVLTLGLYLADSPPVINKFNTSCIEELHAKRFRTDTDEMIFKIIEFRKEKKNA